ncbi:LolA family protein [Paenibacillus pasadenensis]|uniref:Outer membrane lipoprotein receptor n=2 Tax=Paenibacillus TaxID=44249 RepID=A0A2N5N3G5_9BACL|nr:outer membrane lipoprotein carrier protein LolA [Paenibacillus pasadenensis]PLT44881.1 outer membrane lipoprotein receptor [Paenibacillus pasadenensis]
MRRISLIAALMACFILVLAGCGKKDAGSVVKELGKLQEKTETYQGTGTMTLHTATQPLQYKVDVKFQKPNYYRIALTNEKKDLTQIVLRNDEGVFVLTPSLNKVFRFQSNWPEEQGQVYLYQTLVESILKDNSRQFASDKDSYVFDVMANYQNASLARQKIWLSKDDYAPKQVEVSDSNSAVLVDVKFDSFKFNEKLEKSVFDTKANLQSSPAAGSQPTTAVPEGEPGASKGTETDGAAGAGTDGAGTDGNAAEGGVAADPSSSSFIPMEPSYLGPEGIAFKDSSDIEFGGNPGVLLRYDGTYSYTLIETQPDDYASAAGTGRIVDLGYTVGQLSEGQPMTLAWTYQGTYFRLTSDNLPENELVKVAQSVVDDMTK